MDLGKAVKDIRTLKNISQGQLAKDMGVHPNYLSMVENGKRNPSQSFLDKLSYVTKTPVQIIFWKAITKDDIRLEKREAYHMLKPVLDSIIDQLV